jgi:prophage maintenance system killer protein
MEIMYPTIEKIIEFNLLALNLIKARKADQPKVLSRKKIADSLEWCQNLEGGIYDKAVCLLKNLIQGHPFASGNRRTAFIVVKEFLIMNNKPFKVIDDPNHAKVMQGIRENFYTDKEIKEWFSHGKIKEFRRN